MSLSTAIIIMSGPQCISVGDWKSRTSKNIGSTVRVQIGILKTNFYDFSPDNISVLSDTQLPQCTFS